MKKKIIALVAIVALVAVLGICLVACNQADYQKRLEKAGYKVASQSAENLGVEEGKIEWAILAAKGGDSLISRPDTVMVVKFKNTDDAKSFESKMNEIASTVDGTTVKRSGKIVIAGTEQGVKDAQ